MTEILQSGTLQTEAGDVTFMVTDATISMTYADGVISSMPNISYDFDLATNEISATSEVLISGDVDLFHVNRSVV